LVIGLDSSVLVELLSKDATRHIRTVLMCEALLRDGAEWVLTDQAILETFSVLSRSPLPIGLPPRDVERLLVENFGQVKIAALRPGLAWETIRHTLARGHWGGRVYDASIALATYEAGARLLLTWNVKHFHSVAPAGLEIREP
jgi:predicted nucleic acid-binding protein